MLNGTKISRTSMALFALIFACSQATAHDWDDVPPDNTSPFEEHERWQFVALSQEPDSAHFIGNISRVANAVTFEIVTIMKEKQKNNQGWEYDQYHLHFIGDCSTNQIRRQTERFFAYGSPPRPPAIRTVPLGTNLYLLDLYGVKEGTASSAAFNLACLYDYTEPPEGWVKPWDYATRLFGN